MAEPGMVWKLNKAVYGLKQAGREWYLLFKRLLLEFGFKCSDFDPCLFYLQDGNDLVVLGVHVDDSLILCRNQTLFKKIMDFLSEHFQINDLGYVSHALGIDFQYSKEGIKLSQADYSRSVLDELGFSECNPCATPSAMDDLSPNKYSESLTKHSLQKITGMLLWLSVNTRPDLSYSVARLAQDVSKPSPQVYSRAARILRYLRGTIHTGIQYLLNAPDDRLMAFADSDHAADPSRRSQTGFVFFYQGGPLTWNSKRQNTVSLSSTESEITAATTCAQDAIWYSGLLKELGIKIELPISILEDNAACIVLADTSVIGKRTRHIDIKFKFLNQCVENGQIKLIKVEGAKNIADVFTKPLERNRFTMLCGRMCHSTSLLVPQPSTADQDGPKPNKRSDDSKQYPKEYRVCIAYSVSKNHKCIAEAEPGSHLCRTHGQRFSGNHCRGVTAFNTRCESGTLINSEYCSHHINQSHRPRPNSHGRQTRSSRSAIPLRSGSPDQPSATERLSLIETPPSQGSPSKVISPVPTPNDIVTPPYKPRRPTMSSVPSARFHVQSVVLNSSSLVSTVQSSPTAGAASDPSPVSSGETHFDSEGVFVHSDLIIRSPSTPSDLTQQPGSLARGQVRMMTSIAPASNFGDLLQDQHGAVLIESVSELLSIFMRTRPGQFLPVMARISKQ
jgi:hypothetical protein